MSEGQDSVRREFIGVLCDALGTGKEKLKRMARIQFTAILMNFKQI